MRHTASNIKGITVEIGGDTTKLDKALKNVNTSSRSLQSELTKVNKALKLDPTNVTLIKHKQDILRESIEKTKEKLETLKSVQQQVEHQFNSGQIGADQYRAFQREIENAQQKLNGLNQEAKNFGTSVSPSFIAAKEHLNQFGTKATEAGQKMLPLTAGITAVGAGAVKFASDFQSGMSQVAATMGYTTEQLHNSSSQEAQDFERLKEAAKEMGATTQFSATEASEALNYLALAGYDVDKSISTLPDVLNLAAAGGMELGQACDMVTDAASALNLTTQQTTELVDQMAKTSQKSNTSVAQLGEAILTVGGTANTLSGGMTEMNTALGVLANVGYKGAEGGTHLRNVILSLSSPTDVAAIALKQLGVECMDADGNMRALPDILKDMNAGLAEAGSAEKAQVISKIFNKTDIAAVQGLLSSVTGSTIDLKDALASVNYDVEEHGRTWNDVRNAYDANLSMQENVNAMMSMFGMDADQAAVACTNLAASVDDGTDSWSNLYAEISNANGSASAQAQTMLDNLKGKVTLLKSALEGLGIQIGDILLPIIEALTEKINSFVTWLANLNPAIQKIVVLIAAVVAAVGPVLIVVGKIATGISALMGAFIKIKEVIAGLTIAQNGLNLAFLKFPGTWIVIAIAAVVAAFIYFWNTSEGFRNFWITLWDTIKSACGAVLDWLVNFFTVTIPEAFNSLKELLSSLIEFISNLGQSIFYSIQIVFVTIQEFFINLWEGIKTIFISAITEIVEFITTNFSMCIEGIIQIWDGWSQYISGLWELIKNIFMGALLIICDLVTGNFTQAKEDAQNIWNNCLSALTQIWEGLKTMFNGALTAIVGYVTGLFTTAVTGAQNIWNSFVSFMSGIWATLSAGIQNAWNGFLTTITSFCNNIMSTATSIWNNIVSTITGIMNNLPGLASNAFNSMCSAISSALSGLSGIIQSGFSAGISYIKSLPGQAVGWGRDFINGLKSGIMSGLNSLKESVVSVASTIRSYLHFSVPDVGPLTDYESWMPDFMEGLSNGIEKSKSKVVNSINGLAADMSLNINSNAYIPSFETSSNSTSSQNQSVRSDLILNIENFNNNRSTDVKRLMEEAEFYRKNH